MSAERNLERALLESLGPAWDELVPAAEPPEGFADDAAAAVGKPVRPTGIDPLDAQVPDVPRRLRVGWLIAACLALLAVGTGGMVLLVTADRRPEPPPAQPAMHARDVALQPAPVEGSPGERVPAEPAPGDAQRRVAERTVEDVPAQPTLADGPADLRTEPGDAAARRPEAPPAAEAPAAPMNAPESPPAPEPLLTGPALELYLVGELGVIEKRSAELEISAEAAEVLGRFADLQEKGRAWIRKPGRTSKTIAALSEAYELDAELGGGRGILRDRLRRMLAKVYFVDAVDAKMRQQYARAYRDLRKALEYVPDYELPLRELNELERRAKRLYEVAYVIKSTKPEKAIEHCRTVMGMIDPANPYYGKSKRLAEKLSRGESGRVDDGGF